MGYRCIRCGGITTGDSSETSYELWCECYRPRYKPYKEKKEKTKRVTKAEFKKFQEAQIEEENSFLEAIKNRKKGV